MALGVEMAFLIHDLVGYLQLDFECAGARIRGRGDRADLMKELGWKHWEVLARRSLTARFPDDHQLF